ncbi:MAG: hypothetical protein IKA19_04615 [Muribaculaceae bacterium]|nr:hypothetical protein [Muribaculaceae bacterium]MBR1963957.1 hypothetical protein [Muribaculaceae bacterium]
MEKSTRNKLILLMIQIYWIIVSISIYSVTGAGMEDFLRPIAYIILFCILISFFVKRYHVIGLILCWVALLLDFGFMGVIAFIELPFVLYILLGIVMILNIVTSIYLAYWSK